MIEKITDVKLNVRPVFIGLVHQYYYEGPCRFGKGEELEKDYDVFMNSELYHQFQKDVAENMPLDAVNMMEPIYVERDDWFLTDEDMFRTMAKDIDQVDYYLFSFGIGRGDIYLEFAQRYHKPQGVMPAQCCEATVNTSAVRARGLEAYAYRSWEELGRHMRVLRARKALASTRVMVVTRFNSSRSFSSSDNLVDLNYVTEKFGVQFRYQNFHELMDMLAVRDPKTNPTLPGREACNLTEEDMKEVERLADELIAGAKEVRMEREMLEKSLKGYVLVQKLLDRNGCNAYTMPCPDCCSTRRLNHDQLTFCLTHSLNNENQVPSSCEMDINWLWQSWKTCLTKQFTWVTPTRYCTATAKWLLCRDSARISWRLLPMSVMICIWYSTPLQIVNCTVTKRRLKQSTALLHLQTTRDSAQPSVMTLHRMQVRK